MKNLTWQNPEQLFVAQELINKVKSKCCGIKEYQKNIYQPCISETLFASGLIYQSVIDGGTSESSGTDLYHISHLGHQLAKYGMRLQLPEENLTAKTKDANGLTWESLGTVDDNAITSLFSK